jgi:hypothetical protein
MHLTVYLKRAGLTTGPSRKKTRHSDLSVVKSFLLGKPPIGGYQAHNNFGLVVHEEFLLKKKSKRKLTEVERDNANGMLKALFAHPVVKKLMVDLICEKRRYATLNGVPIGYTPDGLHKRGKWIIDLKTTVCSNEFIFWKKAVEYGYVRQGITYCTATGVKEYYIIGIQKVYPFKVFIHRLKDYPEQVKYAEQELKFLLYFYKNYGSFKKIKVVKE